MIKVAKQDWDKFIRDNNPEVFTETHINQWIESNKELLQKSEANELSEEEGVLADNFKTELNHFTRVAVMGPNPDPLQKSLNTEIFYIREQQVDWDKAEDGEIEKSRGGVYKDTSMNRKLGRVGQRFGGKKESGGEDDDKKKRNLWIADRADQLAKKHPDKSNDQLLRMAGKEWESKGTDKPEGEEKSRESNFINKFSNFLTKKDRSAKEIHDFIYENTGSGEYDYKEEGIDNKKLSEFMKVFNKPYSDDQLKTAASVFLNKNLRESKGIKEPEGKEDKGKSGSELSESVKKIIIDSQSDPSSKNAMRGYFQKEGYKFSSEDGRLKVTNPGGSVSYLGGANSGNVLKEE